MAGQKYSCWSYFLLDLTAVGNLEGQGESAFDLMGRILGDGVMMRLEAVCCCLVLAVKEGD